MTVTAVDEEIRPRVPPSQGTARTEMEVAADVLARLINRQALRGDEEALRLIANITGVPGRAIKAAIDFQKRFSFRPPKTGPCDTAGVPLPVVAASPDATKRHAAQRATTKYKAKNPTPTTRVCSDCGNELPLSDFTAKQFNKDGSTVYHYRCDKCRGDYNHRRYISVRAEKQLGALIRFVLHDDDELAEKGCPYCPDPLEAGQVVAGQVRLAHVTCLAKALTRPDLLDVSTGA